MIGGSHSGVLEDPVLPGRYSILYSRRFVLRFNFVSQHHLWAANR